MTELKKVYLEITNVCNLRCSFCPGTRRPRGFLSPEGFRTLAERLRPHTRYLYLHLMGEPLLHPDLEELLAIAARLDFFVMLTTNGVLLPEREALLRSSPAVKKVSVSLHSFQGEPEGFPSYLDGCLSFARNAAGDGKRCALRLWNLENGPSREDQWLNRAVLERMESFFPRPWKEDWQGTTLAPGVFLEWGERFRWPGLSGAPGGAAPPSSGTSGFCHGLRDHVGVLWDGTVVPCCLDHDGEIPLGSLYRQSLEEILASPRARAIYDGFSRRRAVEPLCRTCGRRTRFGAAQFFPASPCKERQKEV